MKLAFGCFLEASWATLGASWERPGGLLEASWGPLGGLWGASGGPLGGRLGLLRPLGGLLGTLGRVAAGSPLVGLLGASWGRLKDHKENLGLFRPSWAPPGGILTEVGF